MKGLVWQNYTSDVLTHWTLVAKVERKTSRRPALRVGDRVKGTYDDTVYLGTVFAVNAKGTRATIRRNDGHTGFGVKIPGRFYGGASGWLVERKVDGQFGASEGDGSLTVIRKHRAKSQLVAA